MTIKELRDLVKATHAQAERRAAQFSGSDNPQVVAMRVKNEGYLMALADVLEAIRDNPVALKIHALP